MTYRTGIVYNVISLLLGVLLVGGFCAYFIQHSIDENNKKFCTVLLTMTGAPDQDAQPETQYGKDLQEYNKAVQRDLVDLQAKYECPSSKEK